MSHSISIPKQSTIAALIVQASLGRCILYDLMKALARTDQSWQKSEWFFCREPFETLTGLKAERSGVVARFFFSEEAIEWLYQNCLNPYFFWSVIGKAAESASSFPLTEEDIKVGGAKIVEHHLQGYIEYSGSDGVCHAEILRSIGDALRRGELTDPLREAGLAAGILMLRLQRPNLMIGRDQAVGQVMEVIFNPLFHEMAKAQLPG